ncbi:MAG: ferritin [Saprospirales bacterium]|nr:ferritin [Saprospirales bacterium]MBK8489443.1 ferritin [Saprospirales bacterium]
MLSKAMEKSLNEQIALEGYASFLYLSMASWCENQTLTGCAAFMFRQSEEERQHMLRIFHYINDVGEHALTPAVAQPPYEWPSIQVLLEQVYAHEQKVSASIDRLVAQSYEEKDHKTLSFLQWYVEEQREEETLMRTILDRIRLIGEGPQSLYYIDKEISAINKIQVAEKAAEGGA